MSSHWRINFCARARVAVASTHTRARKLRVLILARPLARSCARARKICTSTRVRVAFLVRRRLAARRNELAASRNMRSRTQNARERAHRCDERQRRATMRKKIRAPPVARERTTTKTRQQERGRTRAAASDAIGRRLAFRTSQRRSSPTAAVVFVSRRARARQFKKIR